MSSCRPNITVSPGWRGEGNLSLTVQGADSARERLRFMVFSQAFHCYFYFYFSRSAARIPANGRGRILHLTA